VNTRQLRVAVVEDEPRLRELLVREIAAMGFTSEGFRSAEEAWPALREPGHDAVFVDLNLPGEDGMELFRRVRAQRPELAVIVLTGFGTLDTAVQALRWGARDYLTKPCSLDQIEAVLARLLEQRRGDAIERAAASEPAPRAEPAPRPARTLEEVEREQILAALRRHGGNKTETARELGISLRTLYNKLNAYRRQGYAE